MASYYHHYFSALFDGFKEMAYCLVIPAVLALIALQRYIRLCSILQSGVDRIGCFGFYSQRSLFNDVSAPNDLTLL